MGRMIVKAERDRDLYLIWSSVVDAPICIGTRQELLDYYREKEGGDGVRRAERAFVQADERGSSAHAGIRAGWWEDEELRVMEGSPDDGWYHLPRARLTEYAEALLRDDDEAAQALLVCWQRHGEDDEGGDHP